MSGEFYCFNFSLRGPDSLASKWISEKRKTKGTLKENGANIYAISDYIHEVFCFEKLYGTEHSSNVLFNQIIKLNNFDKDHIVLFEDIILIPFTFSMRSYESGSFKEFTNDFEQEPIYEDKPASKSKLGDLLSATEIKEMLINIYHINYNLRSDVNIKDKKYDEIIKGEYLNFKDKAKLDLFAPYIFEIPTQKVLKSSEETPVAVSLTETAIQPEVNDTSVEGYFYVKSTGEYAGKNGNKEDCYILNDGIQISNNLDKTDYTSSQVTKLEITHDQFNKICGVIYDEDSGSFDIMAALTQTSYNAVDLSKPGLKLYEKSKYVANLLYRTTYSTVPTKKELKDTDKTDKQKLMRKALIHVLQGGQDYSNCGVRWDGIDFLTKGKNHPKAKNDGGISITKDLWNTFVNNWGSTKYNGIEYTKEETIKNIPFVDSTLNGDAKEKAIDDIKKECTNLYQVTDSLFETEGTGKYNKGNILNKATTVIGKTIFWGTNKTESKNKGYIWKNLLNSNWFKV